MSCDRSITFLPSSNASSLVPWRGLPESAMMNLPPKSRIFWPLAIAFLCADCATKRAAVELLSPANGSHDVLGGVVRFTLAYNRGAAMSIPVGEGARPFLIVATILTLAVIAMVYRQASPQDRALAAATALL